MGGCCENRLNCCDVREVDDDDDDDDDCFQVSNANFALKG
jgi:hypothetical protein